MKRLKRLKTFESYKYTDESIAEDIKSSNNIEELKYKVEEYNLEKRELMDIAYNGDTKNVDSAIPSNIWEELEYWGGTYWFVMDYTANKFGELTHLGYKILGKEFPRNNIK